MKAYSKDELRSMFEEELSYEQISADDVFALACYIGIECMKHNRENRSALYYRIPTIHRNLPKVALAKGRDGIKSAFIRIDGHYFENREAVSFNEDGFIGFCGWADSKNERAILDGFYRWLNEYMGCDFGSARMNVRTIDSMQELAGDIRILGNGLAMQASKKTTYGELAGMVSSFADTLLELIGKVEMEETR